MRRKTNMQPIIVETKEIIKDCWWELFLKFLISMIYRGALLIIPIYWGKSIDMLTIGKMPDCYRYVIVALVITLGYYASACVNHIIYYKLYDRMYKDFSKSIYRSVVNNSLYSLSRFKLGEFSNIINNDIDIVVAFLGDFALKFARILELFIIFC